MYCVRVNCPAISDFACDPMDCSPPGSSVHGVLQARILEWDLPDSGIDPRSPALQADSLPSEPPGKSILMYYFLLNHIYLFE